MKRLSWIAVLGGALALGGCLGFGGDENTFYNPSKPLDKMSHEELCSYYGHYRDNPDLSAQSKEVVTKQMGVKGCI